VKKDRAERLRIKAPSTSNLLNLETLLPSKPTTDKPSSPEENLELKVKADEEEAAKKSKAEETEAKTKKEKQNKAGRSPRQSVRISAMAKVRLNLCFIAPLHAGLQVFKTAIGWHAALDTFTGRRPTVFCKFCPQRGYVD
jgi:hypothetical protein